MTKDYPVFDRGDTVRLIDDAPRHQSPFCQIDNPLILGDHYVVAYQDGDGDVFLQGLEGCVRPEALVKCPTGPESFLKVETITTKRLPEGPQKFSSSEWGATLHWLKCGGAEETPYVRMVIAPLWREEDATALFDPERNDHSQVFSAEDLREHAAVFLQLASDLEELEGENS